jgi:2-hydroxychromene-2-carboxylate isomerase
VIRVELFFDCSSPGTYLCFHRLGLLADELGFEMVLRPIFIGGVFKAVNPGVFTQRATMPKVKEAYFVKDYADWSRFTGIRVMWPQPFHPVNSIKAMRGVTAAGHHGKLREVATATFRAYFRDGLDISQDEVLRGVCHEANFDSELYFRESAREEIKNELRDTTEELMRRGGFGSPTMFLDGADMYFGNDRLEIVRFAINRKRAAR